MGKLLIENEKIIIKDGKLVILTGDASDCECCEPDCNTLLQKCFDTNEYPVRRPWKFEVDISNDGETFEYSRVETDYTERFLKTQFGSCVPLEDGDLVIDDLESDINYSYRVNGLSALSGTYFTRQVGNQSNELCLNSSEEIVFPVVPISGTFDYSVRLRRDFTCVGECPSFYDFLRRDFTCIGSIPFIGWASINYSTLNTTPTLFDTFILSGTTQLINASIVSEIYPLRDFDPNDSSSSVTNFISVIRNLTECQTLLPSYPGFPNCETKPLNVPAFPTDQMFGVGLSKRCFDTNLSYTGLRSSDLFCEYELDPGEEVVNCGGSVASTRNRYIRETILRTPSPSVDMVITDA